MTRSAELRRRPEGRIQATSIASSAQSVRGASAQVSGSGAASKTRSTLTVHIQSTRTAGGWVVRVIMGGSFL